MTARRYERCKESRQVRVPLRFILAGSGAIPGAGSDAKVFSRISRQPLESSRTGLANARGGDSAFQQFNREASGPNAAAQLLPFQIPIYPGANLFSALRSAWSRASWATSPTTDLSTTGCISSMEICLIVNPLDWLITIHSVSAV